MAKREVQVTITANVSQAEKKLNELAKTLEQSFKMRSGQGIDSVGQSLKFLGYQSAQAVKTLGSLKGTFESLRMAGGGLVGAFRGLGLAMRDSWKESKEMAKNMDSIDKKAKTSTLSIKNFLGAFGLGFSGVKATQFLISASDTMQELNSRLATTEGSASAAARAMDSIYAVAQRTSTGLKDVSENFMEISQSLGGVGATQKQVIGLTENLTKIMKISGMGASQAKSAIVTLSQAMQSGTMTMGQFNTLSRQGGQTLSYLADMLGISYRELRKMAKEGKISADVLMLLAENSDKINKDFADMPATVGDAMTRIANAFIKTAGESEALRLIFGALAKAIEFVAKNLNAIVGAAIAVGIAAMVLNVGKLVVMFQRLAVTIGLAKLAVEGFKKSTVILWAIGLAAAAIIWAFEKIAGHLGKFGPGVQNFKNQLDKLEESAREMSQTIAGALNVIESKINNTRKNLSETLTQTSKAFEAMSKILDAGIKSDLAKVNDRYKQEQQLIKDTHRDSVERYMAETTALANTTAESLSILKDGATKKMTLIEQEAEQRRRAIAVQFDSEQERARALVDLERGVLEKKRGVLEQIAADYKKHIDTLNSEAQRHFDAVRDIEDKKRLLTMNAEEKIRELRRKAMDDYSAYQDRIKEKDEYISKARESLLAGNAEAAIEYAKKAEQAASSLSTAIKIDDMEMVSQQQAVNNAINAVNESAEIQKQAFDLMAQSRQQAGEAAKLAAEQEAFGLGLVQMELDGINRTVAEGATLTVEANAEQAETDIKSLISLIEDKEYYLELQLEAEGVLEEIEGLQAKIKDTGKVDVEVRSNIPELQGRADQLHKKLQEETRARHSISDNAPKVQKAIDNLKKPTSSTHTIYIKKVQKNALGGLIQGFASGGQVFKRAMGRVFGPGTGTSDSIPSMLSNGEFVIRASMVKKWGAAFFESLNAGFLPAMPQMAMGGAVAGVSSGSNEALTVTFRAGELEAPVRISDPASRQSMKAFAHELQRIKLVQG